MRPITVLAITQQMFKENNRYLGVIAVDGVSEESAKTTRRVAAYSMILLFLDLYETGEEWVLNEADYQSLHQLRALMQNAIDEIEAQNWQSYTEGYEIVKTWLETKGETE